MFWSKTVFLTGLLGNGIAHIFQPEANAADSGRGGSCRRGDTLKYSRSRHVARIHCLKGSASAPGKCAFALTDGASVTPKSSSAKVTQRAGRFAISSFVLA